MCHLRTTALLFALWLMPHTALADPLYHKVYTETFPKVEKHRCSVCHEGVSKRVCNPYGLSVHERLGERRSKDVLAIRRVLEELGPSPYSK
ncbi:MAG: hypothetical protein B7Z55_04015 [Planctomycetales bacterium 12-60-4]|nr:MAG: hypothetical protein B7Z55_04015 [Planctomycetales bacterium 12-60-4]